MSEPLDSPMINTHFINIESQFSFYDKHRSNFQYIYADYLKSEPGLAGRVIDIGCGHGDNPAYRHYCDKLGHLDGVDPFPMVTPAPNLENRWTCALEDLPVADGTYDLAYSYNVVEHVPEVDPFLRKALAIIKPGACYWSMSPNYYHPFARITRFVQSVGLLKLYRKLVNAEANDYPAYYKLSREKNIIDSIIEQKLPVSQIDFYYIPNVNWDTYFPRSLRFIPHLLDRLWLIPNPRRSFIFMLRIQKAG